MKPEIQSLLRFFRNPTRFTKEVLRRMLTMPDDALIEALIQRNRLNITSEDQELIEAAKAEARAHIKRGQHHLFSYIQGESGAKPYPGLQETYPRDADCESCAEVGAISNLDIAKDKPKTVVTIHYMPIPERDGRGVTTIVPPCLRCAGRFRHLAVRHKHNFGIIAYRNSEIVKVSVNVAHLLQYPEGYFYGNDDHHKV